MVFQIEELRKMLSSGPTTFYFRKKDGTARKMTATTNRDWIPNREEVKQRSEKAITVYDMEKQGFRNVHVDAFICN